MRRAFGESSHAPGIAIVRPCGTIATSALSVCRDCRAGARSRLIGRSAPPPPRRLPLRLASTAMSDFRLPTAPTSRLPLSTALRRSHLPDQRAPACEQEPPLLRQRDMALPSPADTEVLSQLVERSGEELPPEDPSDRPALRGVLVRGDAYELHTPGHWPPRCAVAPVTSAPGRLIDGLHGSLPTSTHSWRRRTASDQRKVSATTRSALSPR